jgi:hypothetical protein
LSSKITHGYKLAEKVYCVLPDLAVNLEVKEDESKKGDNPGDGDLVPPVAEHGVASVQHHPRLCVGHVTPGSATVAEIPLPLEETREALDECVGFNVDIQQCIYFSI